MGSKMGINAVVLYSGHLAHPFVNNNGMVGAKPTPMFQGINLEAVKKSDNYGLYTFELPLGWQVGQLVSGGPIVDIDISKTLHQHSQIVEWVGNKVTIVGWG